MSAESNAPLLDYAVITDPFPLYATTPNTPLATLQIVVSNGGTTSVYCRDILISMPYGKLAQHLLDIKSGDGQARDWTITAVDKESYLALPDGDYAHFKATPSKSQEKVENSGVAFLFENLKINEEAGTARIEIRETTSLQPGKWPDNPRFTTCTVTKFQRPKIPTELVLDFHAQPGDASNKTDIQEAEAGEEIVLTWRGPDIAYTILHGPGAHTDNPVTNKKAKEWKGKVFRDTTFQLQYVIADTTHTQTTTATVRDPQLTGLTVSGPFVISQDKQEITVKDGALTIIQDKQKIIMVKGGVEATGKIHSAAEISSSAEISGKTLKAAGAVTAATVTATKLTAAPENPPEGPRTEITPDRISTDRLDTHTVDVTKKDTVPGTVTAEIATIGGLEIPKDVRPPKFGTMKKMKIEDGKVEKADTDGLIIGYVHSDYNKESYIAVEIDGCYFKASSSKGNNVWGNTFCAPVAKGHTYKITWTDGTPDSKFQCFWLPVSP